MVSKTKFVAFYGLNIIFLLLLLLFSSITSFSDSTIPDIIQYRKNYIDGSGLTVETLEKLSNETNFKEIAFSVEKAKEYIDTDIVLPVLINENYLSFCGFTIQGSGITTEIIDSKSRCVIVGEVLASKLFFTGNYLGQSINVLGEDYFICGIYKEDTSFLSEISKDDYNRVYIPYSVCPNYQTEAIDNISIAKNENSNIAITALSLINQSYYEFDYSLKKDAVFDFYYLFILIIILFITFILIKVVIVLLNSIYTTLKNQATGFYFWELLKVNAKFIFMRILFILGLVIFATMLFNLYKLNVIIIPKYLPNDNIFDYKHYIDTFVQSSQNVNSTLFAGDNYFQNIYIKSFWLNFFLLVIILFAFCIVYILLIYFYRKSRFQVYEMIFLYALVILAAFIFGSVLSLNYLLLWAKLLLLIVILVICYILNNHYNNKDPEFII